MKIYKLTCNETGLCYYGHTKKTLDDRLRGHKNNYTAFINGKTNFISSYDIIENNDYKIELIEECDDEKTDEREGFYIRNFECVNKNIPDRDSKEYWKEWYENNKDLKKQMDKEYYEKNKDTILGKLSIEGKKRYICECGKTLTIGSKSRHEKSNFHKIFIDLKKSLD
jgi:hypothetical protein